MELDTKLYITGSDGKKYMGIVRSTYIIDENGVITGAFPKVKATENPADMLKQL